MTSLGKMPAIVLLTLALAACGQSAEQVGSSVLRSMQHKFTNDLELSKLRVAIAKVVVIKETGNSYQGIATVLHDGKEWQVPVQVTADGDNVLWRTEPGAFAFVVMNDLKRARDQSK